MATADHAGFGMVVRAGSAAEGKNPEENRG